MAITLTKFHIMRVLNQIMSNLVGLQHDMVFNANAWKAMAQAQSPDIAKLASFMTGSEYLRRLQWIADYKNNNPNWPAVTAMYQALGGDPAEATTLYTQMKSVADQLAAANITTYSQVINISNQILAAVQPPDSLWPE
jgi:uncharacterized membrane protein YdcZ (DUF606 family)